MTARAATTITIWYRIPPPSSSKTAPCLNIPPFFFPKQIWLQAKNSPAQIYHVNDTWMLPFQTYRGHPFSVAIHSIYLLCTNWELPSSYPNKILYRLGEPVIIMSPCNGTETIVWIGGWLIATTHSLLSLIQYPSFGQPNWELPSSYPN